MDFKKQIKALDEVDAIVDLLMDKLVQLKNDCHGARKKLEGVSTPSVRQGQQSFAHLTAKRRQRLFKQNQS